MQAVYGDRCVDVSTVRRWVRRFKDGELGQADLSDKTRRTDFKNQCSVGGSVSKFVVILQKNNYAALKIIDVGMFLLSISLKYLFPFIFYLSGGKTYQPALVESHFYKLTENMCSFFFGGGGSVFSPSKLKCRCRMLKV